MTVTEFQPTVEPAPAAEAAPAASPAVQTLRDRPGDLVIATVARIEGDTGVQTHTRMLRDSVVRAGVACRVIDPFCGSRKWIPVFGVRKALPPISPSWSTRWYRHWHRVALAENLAYYVERNSACAVVAQCPLAADAALAVRDRMRGNFPVALVCHFNYSEATEYRDQGVLDDPVAFQAILDLEARVLRDVDEVVYVSGWAKRIVEQERGIRPQSSRVIWNGVADVVPARGASRTELGVAEKDVAFINVGTLEARKNQLGLLDAFAAVAAARPDVKLLLVGDGAQRPQVEARIAELKLADRVRLLGHRRDVPALFQAADVYVHYSKLENCPVVLLEAARAGLTAAAIPAGGVPEIQRALGNPTELCADDPARSAQALLPLVDDAPLRARLGQRARRGFERHFTAEAMTASYLEVLSKRRTP